MAEVTMPRLSDTMEEGTIGRWLKQPGDQVAKGEILVEIETDKATMELESYESGTLQRQLVAEGETVPIGTPIAMIGDGVGADVPAPAAPPAPAAVASPAAAPAAASAANGHTGDPDGRILASPVAKRLAGEYGVDLRQVAGTGPGGRIIKENVEAFLATHGKGTAALSAPAAAPAPVAVAAPAPVAAAAPAPVAVAAPAAAPAPAVAAASAGDTVEPMTRMRQAISKVMSTAKPGIPHIYVTAEIDMGAALALRKQINESGASPVKISVNDLIVKATALALQKVSVFQTFYTTGPDGKPATLHRSQINIGVAVAIDEGLVAPVVRDANKKSISTISAEVKDMAGRAREGKIRPDELDGGTFNISNLGMFDVVEFGAIISPGQTGILAVGAVRQVPVVRDGAIVVGEMMFATVSADHRIADGASAAQLLQEIRRLLEHPMSLLV